MTPRYNGKRQLVLDRYSDWRGWISSQSFSNEETDDLAMFLLPRAREIEEAQRRATQEAFIKAQLKADIEFHREKRERDNENEQR